MSQWMKNLASSLCVLTILMHLLPQGKYTKYVRFYAGLLFLLIVSAPFFRFFAGEQELERLLRLEFLKEEYTELEATAGGLEELKSNAVQTAYQQELYRQIHDLAKAYSLNPKAMSLHFSKENGYTIEEAVLWLTESSDYTAILEMKREIEDVYGLEADEIVINTE